MDNIEQRLERLEQTLDASLASLDKTLIVLIENILNALDLEPVEEKICFDWRQLGAYAIYRNEENLTVIQTNSTPIKLQCSIFQHNNLVDQFQAHLAVSKTASETI